MVNIFEDPQIFLARVHSYSTFSYCLRIPFVRCCHLLNLIFMFAGLIDFLQESRTRSNMVVSITEQILNQCSNVQKKYKHVKNISHFLLLLIIQGVPQLQSLPYILYNKPRRRVSFSWVGKDMNYNSHLFIL